MTIGRKDFVAAALTVLVVATFLATHQGWGVPLVGGSHRWAALAITILGALACMQGTVSDERAPRLLGGLGTLAAALAILAIASGSLTVLSLLVIAVVLLWVAATVRHTGAGKPRTVLPEPR